LDFFQSFSINTFLGQFLVFRIAFYELIGPNLFILAP